jgi:hypothetical protein
LCPARTRYQADPCADAGGLNSLKRFREQLGVLEAGFDARVQQARSLGPVPPDIGFLRTHLDAVRVAAEQDSLACVDHRNHARDWEALVVETRLVWTKLSQLRSRMAWSQSAAKMPFLALIERFEEDIAYLLQEAVEIVAEWCACTPLQQRPPPQ